MSAAKRILDVGQCNVDGPRLGRFLKREFNCVIDRAQSREEALTLVAAHHYDLVLVNRLLNQDRTSGIDVITTLRAADPKLRLMLVSDYPQAQEKAVQEGAIPGFGKSALESVETEQLLRSALSST